MFILYFKGVIFDSGILKYNTFCERDSGSWNLSIKLSMTGVMCKIVESQVVKY